MGCRYEAYGRAQNLVRGSKTTSWWNDSAAEIGSVGNNQEWEWARQWRGPRRKGTAAQLKAKWLSSGTGRSLMEPKCTTLPKTRIDSFPRHRWQPGKNQENAILFTNSKRKRKKIPWLTKMHTQKKSSEQERDGKYAKKVKMCNRPRFEWRVEMGTRTTYSERWEMFFKNKSREEQPHLTGEHILIATLP